MTAAVDSMSLARAERADLAEFLATLSQEQWEAPTLCTKWRVRDVVAHMFSYDEVGFVGLVGRFAKGRMNPDRINAIGVAAHAGDTPAELLALVRKYEKPRGLTSMFGGRIALTDGMIHHQDIRLPLGQPRTIPVDRMLVALDFARTARPLGAAERTAGLRLVATDVGWSGGEGPVVEGPAEPLLMAMGGRSGFTDKLSGPGVSILDQRIAV